MRWFVFFVVFILFSYNVYSYAGDRPVDCNPNNPNIFYGNQEICNNNIDDNCNIDEGIDFDVDANTGVDKKDISCCNINKVYWSKTNANVGDVVELIVETKGACNNLEVNFNVKEDDLLVDDNVNLNPLPVTVNEVNGVYKAIGNWVVEYQNDGLFGDPEYYFTASITDPNGGVVEKRSDLLYLGEGIGECGDNNLDLGENCYSCPDDAGCGLNENCGFLNGGWQCDGGETSCNNNNICEQGENCLCGDCLNEQDGCVLGLMCNSSLVCGYNPGSDGICNPSYVEGDPDCCDFTNPSWRYLCIGIGQKNRMSVVGRDCGQLGMEFRVYEDDLINDDLITTIGREDPNFKIENGIIKADWVVVDSGESSNEYYFKIGSGSQEVKSSNMVTKQCNVNVDGDCDNVCNPGSSGIGGCEGEDICQETEPCAEVDENGCSLGQSSCLSQWDCTNAIWGECDEDTGVRTRDVSKCSFIGMNPDCEVFNPPSSKQCVKIEKFPFFSFVNVLVVIFMLMVYYFRKN